MTRTCVLRSLFAGALLVGATGTFLAQTAAAQAAKPEMMMVTMTKVKPDMVGEWTDLQTQLTAALKKQGQKWREYWTPGVFASGSTFVAVSPISSFAQFDSPNPLIASMGERNYEMWRTRLIKCVDSSNSVAVVQRPDLSVMTEAPETPKMALIVTMRALVGKNRQFEEIIKTDLLPAMKKGGLKNVWANQTVFGGDPNEYTFLVVVDNFAAFDKPHPIMAAMGEEGYKKYMDKMSMVVGSVEYVMMRRNPTISYMMP